MNTRRACLALAVSCAVVSLSALTACDRRADEPPPPPAAPLKLQAYLWPGAFWVDIASDQGWFTEAGLEVEVVNTNADYFGALAAIADGRLDVGFFTLFDAIRFRREGADLVCVAAVDQSDGMDGIVARHGIASVTALRHKRVGVAKGSYNDYILGVVLAYEGMARTDLTIVDVPGEQSPAALARGAVDAAVTWEPYLTDAKARSNGRKLWDSSRIPGISPSMLTTRRAVARSRTAELQKLLQIWQRGAEFIRRRPDDAFVIVARVNKVPLATVRALAALDRVLTLRDNLDAFSYAQGFTSLHGTIRVMNDYFARQGTAGPSVDSDALLDPRFLKGLP